MFFLSTAGKYYLEINESIVLEAAANNHTLAMLDTQDIAIDENGAFSRPIEASEITRANNYIKKHFYDIAVQYLKTDINFKIEYLWYECKKYIEYRLDSAGFTVLLLLSREYPNSKAARVIDWTQRVWTDYYLRREAIRNNNDILSTSTDGEGTTINIYVDYNFSKHGELPYDYYNASTDTTTEAPALDPL